MTDIAPCMLEEAAAWQTMDDADGAQARPLSMQAEPPMRVEPPTLFAQSLAHVVCETLRDLMPPTPPLPARSQVCGHPTKAPPRPLEVGEGGAGAGEEREKRISKKD